MFPRPIFRVVRSYARLRHCYALVVSCSIPEHSGAPVDVIPPVPSARQREDATSLGELTTIGVGGAVASVINAATEEEVIEAVRQADEDGVPVLVLGGGSNILASDETFDGVVVRDTRRDIHLLQEGGCEGANLRVLAGTPWDDFVVHTIENEWMGVEALSGIPGTVGAAPVQNIGAYGQEVAGSIARVRVWDRQAGRPREIPMADLHFGYRSSILKESLRHGWGPSPRYIVLSVDFQLRIASLSAPVAYKQLASALGVQMGARVPAAELRAAVLELRRSKGMVLDDADRDTYSCGSFFTNPILTAEQADALPEDAPRFPVTDLSHTFLGKESPEVAGLVKSSAAWLINHAGFNPGFGLPGPAALSTKHCLALTNRGGASAAQIRDLARTVRDGVESTFGVRLEPEPVLVGGGL
ncbi:MAG: UDP-N-acetylmuramate dehydrogenase [Actinomycetaceae bacterium]|nr:UDP-N-acetylmuramate dehydrogenase [Actinomycetaceae bacterium]